MWDMAATGLPYSRVSTIHSEGTSLRSLACYTASRGLSELSYQVAAVAVGWQIYALSHSALYLGLSGLVHFMPTLLLVFGAGHVADRYDRRRIVAVCQWTAGLTAGLLAWGSLEGRHAKRPRYRACLPE
jgi:hypothetical protein